MNWKAAVLLFVVFFASAVTMVTVGFSMQRLGSLIAPQRTPLETVSAPEPLGDGIPGPGLPH